MMTSLSTRRYSEMIQYETLEERFEYLKLSGTVGAITFGYDRFLNQAFYKSRQWRDICAHVHVRDNGFDLGVEDHPIGGRILVHHMNPLTPEQLESGTPDILDPEFLICVSHNTHNAIHYGTSKLLPKPFVERRPGDHIFG